MTKGGISSVVYKLDNKKDFYYAEVIVGVQVARRMAAAVYLREEGAMDEKHLDTWLPSNTKFEEVPPRVVEYHALDSKHLSTRVFGMPMLLEYLNINSLDLAPTGPQPEGDVIIHSTSAECDASTGQGASKGRGASKSRDASPKSRTYPGVKRNRSIVVDFGISPSPGQNNDGGGSVHTTPARGRGKSMLLQPAGLFKNATQDEVSGTEKGRRRSPRIKKRKQGSKSSESKGSQLEYQDDPFLNDNEGDMERYGHR